MFLSAQRGSRFSIAAVLVALGGVGGGAVAGASPSVRSVPPRAASPALQRALDQLVAAGAPGAIALVGGGVEDQERWRRDGRERRGRSAYRAPQRRPDYLLAPLVGLYRGDRFRAWRPSELVALVAGRPPDFPPGSAWSYSDTGYVLVGMIVERVSVRRLGRELERRIFRPLRMRDTSFPTHFPSLVGRHAHGYSLQLDDGSNPIEGTLFDISVFDPSLAWGAGNAVSDVEDLARFVRALLAGRLLPPGAGRR